MGIIDQALLLEALHECILRHRPLPLERPANKVIGTFILPLFNPSSAIQQISPNSSPVLIGTQREHPPIVLGRYQLPGTPKQMRPYNAARIIRFPEGLHRRLLQPHTYCPAHHPTLLSLHHTHPRNQIGDGGKLRTRQLLIKKSYMRNIHSTLLFCKDR